MLFLFLDSFMFTLPDTAAISYFDYALNSSCFFAESVRVDFFVFVCVFDDASDFFVFITDFEMVPFPVSIVPNPELGIASIVLD